tara:strand:- start:252 stop:554 length:303 start_codon:yes stop_codon:yes gene_type:complete
MPLDIEYTCPLGSKCEEVKDGKIMRCAWYTKVMGKDPQSEKDIEDWACSMSWMPMLMVEMSQTNRGQTSVLESFRNETVTKQGEFNALVQQRNNLIRIKK